MGCVYKITFPDGYFYIGSTINLSNRLKQHRYDCSSRRLKAKIKEFKVSKQEFLDNFVSILHTGDDYLSVESQLINHYNEDPLILNISGVIGYHKLNGRPRNITFKVEQVDYEKIEELSEINNINMRDYVHNIVMQAVKQASEAKK